MVFVLAMLLHPDVQRKAQAALDAVLGSSRLPAFDDRDRLRYIDHVVYETYRWAPLAPMGIPHKSLHDDIYQGMLIPAGSIVFANSHAMSRDARLYRDPDMFDPDRYLPVAEGGRGEPVPVGQFGFGRR